MPASQPMYSSETCLSPGALSALHNYRVTGKNVDHQMNDGLQLRRLPSLEAALKHDFEAALAEHGFVLRQFQVLAAHGDQLHHAEAEAFAAKHADQERYWMFHGTRFTCPIGHSETQDLANLCEQSPVSALPSCGACSNVRDRHRIHGSGRTPASYTRNLPWAMYYANRASSVRAGREAMIISLVQPGKITENERQAASDVSVDTMWLRNSKEYRIYNPKCISMDYVVMYEAVDKNAPPAGKGVPIDIPKRK